jgi:RNA polymerase primary sigma factor
MVTPDRRTRTFHAFDNPAKKIITTGPSHARADTYSADDSVKMYLTDLRRQPDLLTKEQVIDISRQMSDGFASYLYLKMAVNGASPPPQPFLATLTEDHARDFVEKHGLVDVGNFLMEPREIKIKGDKTLAVNYVKDFIRNEGVPQQGNISQLSEILEEGRKAQQTLIERNLRLVMPIARGYLGQGLALEDIIQEGNHGLIRAAQRFDATSGNSFSTYAVWWIRQAIGRAIADKGNTIRLPVHVFQDVRKYLKVSAHATVELGRDPTKKELRELLSVSADKLSELQEYVRRLAPASLDQPVGEEEDTLGDFVPHHSNEIKESIEDTARKDLVERIKAAAKLTERETQVLDLRFTKGLTLESAGRELGITRERVRQVQEKTVRKLKGAARRLQIDVSQAFED